MREFHALKIADISAMTEYAKCRTKDNFKDLSMSGSKLKNSKRLREGLFPDNHDELPPLNDPILNS